MANGTSFTPNRLQKASILDTMKTPEQLKRIEDERPIDGTPEPLQNELELAAYRMPNGSRFVTLVDGSWETWCTYCERLGGFNAAQKPGWHR